MQLLRTLGVPFIVAVPGRRSLHPLAQSDLAYAQAGFCSKTGCARAPATTSCCNAFDRDPKTFGDSLFAHLAKHVRLTCKRTRAADDTCWTRLDIDLATVRIAVDVLVAAAMHVRQGRSLIAKVPASRG